MCQIDIQYTNNYIGTILKLLAYRQRDSLSTQFAYLWPNFHIASIILITRNVSVLVVIEFVSRSFPNSLYIPSYLLLYYIANTEVLKFFPSKTF